MCVIATKVMLMYGINVEMLDGTVVMIAMLT
jgi:hypothetical protein